MRLIGKTAFFHTLQQLVIIGFPADPIIFIVVPISVDKVLLDGRRYRFFRYRVALHIIRITAIFRYMPVFIHLALLQHVPCCVSFTCV